MVVVVDCSAILGLALEGEPADYASAVLDAIVADEAIVPTLFWFELRNALLMAERRQRLTPDRTAAFLADVAMLPMRVDDQPREATVLALARHHGLTVYDAAYLELALRKGVPLASLDQALVSALGASGGVAFTR